MFYCVYVTVVEQSYIQLQMLRRLSENRTVFNKMFKRSFYSRTYDPRVNCFYFTCSAIVKFHVLLFILQSLWPPHCVGILPGSCYAYNLMNQGVITLSYSLTNDK